MAIQTTPHTQTQKDTDPVQADLEPQQVAGDSGLEDGASQYANMSGGQTGGTRAFNANETREPHRNLEPQSAAQDGGFDTRTPQSENQGISNRSASEESTRQSKVVNERPDAMAGVDQTGHSSERDG